MKKGLVRIIIGCILIFFQALSVMGNCAQGQVISISFANTSVFLFDLISLISYFLVGIIGTILLISGLVAYNRTKEDLDDNEESDADRQATKQEATPQEIAKERHIEAVKVKPEDLQKQPVDKNDAEVAIFHESSINTVASESVNGEEYLKQQPKAEKKKTVKNRYCSRCGSLIDPVSKKCAGCGKQYFKGVRVTKTLLPSAIIFVLLICVSVFAISQHIDNGNLQAQINVLGNENAELRTKCGIADGTIEDLQKKINSKDTRITSLEREVASLEAYKKRTESYHTELLFYKLHCAIVVKGSKKYHIYGCEEISGKTFWMYNTEAAEDRGYKACSKCRYYYLS